MEGKTYRERRRIYRDKLYNENPTSIRELEKLEAKFSRKKLNSAQAVIEWFQKQKFQILIVSGELKYADVQVFRRKRKGRYHWRLYIYPDRLIVECHIDQVDPGKRLYKLHKNSTWLKDSANHLLKDVIQKPDHHYIVKYLVLNENDIKMIKTELHRLRVKAWFESKLDIKKR